VQNGHFLAQYPQQGAAIRHARQFVMAGQFLDTGQGFLKDAILAVQFFAQTADVHAKHDATRQRRDEGQIQEDFAKRSVERKGNFATDAPEHCRDQCAGENQGKNELPQVGRQQSECKNIENGNQEKESDLRRDVQAGNLDYAGKYKLGKFQARPGETQVPSGQISRESQAT
jgi:hypothetical protein